MLGGGQVLGVLALLAPLSARALGSLPFLFANGTVADATQVNANFEALRAEGVSDAETRVYGDGSAGALNIPINSILDWTAAPPANLNFTTCFIGRGSVVTVPSGTAIRCTGGANINGGITVAPGTSDAGISLSGARSGVGNGPLANVLVGAGGIPLGELAARQLR
jgi:hypothetical protein